MNYWNETPLFRFLVFFICGILLAIYFPCLSLRISLTVCGLLISLIYFQFIFRKKLDYYKRRWITGALSYVIVFLTGYALSVLVAEKNYPAHFRNMNHPSAFVGYLQEPIKEKSKSCKTVLKIFTVKENGEWKESTGNCLAYFFKDSESSALKYGDLIAFSICPDEVPVASNPSQFDYKSWLGFNQVFDQVYFPAGKWKLIDHHYGNGLYDYSYSLRSKLLEVFRTNYITGQDYAVLSALILGYEDEIDSEIINAYAASGALHVLSVSGLHVGIIFVAINFFLGFLNRSRKTRLIKSIIIILFLWFYALLTGLSPSVLRSATMLSFIVIGQMTRSHTNLYNTLAASAFFLLGINPFLIMQVGFQLSYMAVLGIIFLQPSIQGMWEPSWWLPRQVWSLTSVSIAAQIATFPLGLFYFHQFPVYFLLSNLIVIPISTVIIYGGIILLIISGWHMGALVVGILTGDVIHFMNESVLFIEKLPCSIISGISITVFESWTLYVCIGTLLLFLAVKRQQYLVISVLSVACLCGSQVLEAIRINQQRQLVVYSVNGKSVTNIIDGKENFIKTDTGMLAARSMMLFNIYHYWWDCGMDESKVTSIQDSTAHQGNYCYYRDFLKYGNFRIAFVSDTNLLYKFTGKTEVDFLILSSNVKTKLKNLSEHFVFKHLIIDSSNSPRKAERLVNEAKKVGVSAYSVPHEGAFVYHLSRE
ncbi:MAG: ComEC/Rec2 family competence protein [Bacteroidota bacterium]